MDSAAISLIFDKNAMACSTWSIALIQNRITPRRRRTSARAWPHLSATVPDGRHERDGAYAGEAQAVIPTLTPDMFGSVDLNHDGC